MPVINLSITNQNALDSIGERAIQAQFDIDQWANEHYSIYYTDTQNASHTVVLCIKWEMSYYIHRRRTNNIYNELTGVSFCL